MSIKEKMAARTAAIAAPSGNRTTDPLARPKTGPGQFLAAMPILAEKEEELERANAALEEANAKTASLQEQLERVLAQGNPTGAAVEIPLDQLHEVPGRRRYMPPEKYKELRENLRNNDLIHPVVVLPREEGGFEIWSGHHRTEAYRELGRPTIWCVLGKATKSSVSAGAFYANLMQSDLTDYEKFVGFQEIRARNPELTQAALAEQSGVSESALSAILSFADLPSEVLDILKERPALIGFNAGDDLAALTRMGKGQRVVEAVRMLASGEISEQKQAVKFASTDQAKRSPVTADTFKVKSGKETYCDVRRAKNIVRLQFKTEDETQRVLEMIRSVLESQAQQRDKNKLF